MSRAALLVLADGRFPAGGHAHSGGAEEAVGAGRIRDAAELGAFCRGRLHTAGLVAAALAAAAADGTDPLALDEAADARTPSPALRTAARQGVTSCLELGPDGTLSAAARDVLDADPA
ncbi:urease accessory UreF family protein, partial [Streptomyces sp. Vc17.3-30]|uniref:urease accessory UreF family protein n=1 Tax=Streptomyces sp. Vc17.3-30 TaxID=2841672 RepID=UPI0034D51965